MKVLTAIVVFSLLGWFAAKRESNEMREEKLKREVSEEKLKHQAKLAFVDGFFEGGDFVVQAVTQQRAGHPLPTFEEMKKAMFANHPEFKP